MRTVQLKRYTQADGYNLGKGMVSGIIVGTIVMGIPIVVLSTWFELPAYAKKWWHNRMRAEV